MLYSVAVGFVTYALMVLVIGLFSSIAPIMGTFLAFGVICLIGGYIARNSRLVRRMCYGLGGFLIAIFAVSEFLMPAIQGQKALFIAIAALFGVVVYVVTRRFTFRRYVNRRMVNGLMVRPAPPFGREWMRWLFAFVM